MTRRDWTPPTVDQRPPPPPPPVSLAEGAGVAPSAGLGEQEIRARALAAAVTICDRATMPDDFVVRDYEVLVLGTADRLAAWIRDGTEF